MTWHHTDPMTYISPYTDLYDPVRLNFISYSILWSSVFSCCFVRVLSVHDVIWRLPSIFFQHFLTFITNIILSGRDVKFEPIYWTDRIFMRHLGGYLWKTTSKDMNPHRWLNLVHPQGHKNLWIIFLSWGWKTCY